MIILSYNDHLEVYLRSKAAVFSIILKLYKQSSLKQKAELELPLAHN